MSLSRIRAGLDLRLLRDFFRWWYAELEALAQPVIQRVVPRRDRVVLNVLPDRIRLDVLRANVRGTEVIEYPAPLEQLSAEQWGQLKSMAVSADVLLQLSGRDILGLRLDALGKGRPTDESIRYRLLSESPMDVALVTFSWRVASSGSGGRRDGGKLEVAICRTQRLQDVLALLSAQGIPVLGVLGLPAWGGEPFDFGAVERTGRQGRRSLGFHRKRILVATAFGMPILALGAVGGLASIDARHRAAEVEAIRAELGDRERLLQRRTELAATSAELGRWASRTAITQVLNDLGEHLPDNTWCSELFVEGQVVRLTGVSADPPAAAKALSSSKLISNTRLSSVGSPIPQRGVSQFEVTAELGARHE